MYLQNNLTLVMSLFGSEQNTHLNNNEKVIFSMLHVLAEHTSTEN